MLSAWEMVSKKLINSSTVSPLPYPCDQLQIPAPTLRFTSFLILSPPPPSVTSPALVKLILKSALLNFCLKIPTKVCSVLSLPPRAPRSSFLRSHKTRKMKKTLSFSGKAGERLDQPAITCFFGACERPIRFEQ